MSQNVQESHRSDPDPTKAEQGGSQSGTFLVAKIQSAVARSDQKSVTLGSTLLNLGRVWIALVGLLHVLGQEMTSNHSNRLKISPTAPR